MAEERAIPRLHITPRAVALLVFTVAFVEFALARVPAAQRVIGWTIAAAAIAALVYPAVDFLNRWIPRWIAIALVALALLAPIATVGYAAISDVQRELSKLEKFAPDAAERIEQRTDRIGEFARQFDLRRKVNNAVSTIPQRIVTGGSTDTGAAISETATRGIAFLTVAFLLIFFLASGRSLVDGAFRQITDLDRRALVRSLATGVYRDAFGYARGAIALALLTGFVAFVVARMAHVPGAAVIGIWVGLLDLLPVFGAFLGWAPLITLAYVQSPGAALGALVAFVIYQTLDSFWIRRSLERSTFRLGRFLPVVGAFGGFELAGFGGALVGILAAAVIVTSLRAYVEYRDTQPGAASDSSAVGAS
ncbi:MAG: AI-2E family transporter [Acidimicrobiia bacterium]